MHDVPTSEDFANHLLSEVIHTFRSWGRRARHIGRAALEVLPYFVSSVVFLGATLCVVVASCLLWSWPAGLLAFGATTAIFSIVWLNDKQPPPPSNITEL